jgi:hypothetical protein
MVKCRLGVQEVGFFGRSITTAGVVPPIKHVQAIQEFQGPEDVKQLVPLLGLVSFSGSSY